MTDDHEIISCMRTMVDRNAAERPDGSQFGVHRDYQQIIEIDAAETALNWLTSSGHITSVVKIETPDPPDVLATLSDGNRHGVEITELVHGPTIAYTKRQRIAGDDTHYYTNWTPELINEELTNLVSKKNKKPARYGTDPVSLVIVCDQPMIKPDQVKETLVKSSVFEHVLVLFSYEPNSGGVGGGTYPIVPLGILP